jgi:hypothetical protein
VRRARGAGRPHEEDVARFEVAVDDPLAVRLVERIGDLTGDVERLFDRQRTFVEPLAQRFPVEVLHHQVRRAVSVADVVEGADVRVVQRGDALRLAIEPRLELGIVGQPSRQDLDGDGALEPRVAGLVDLAHAACPERADDLVRTESGPGR